MNLKVTSAIGGESRIDTPMDLDPLEGRGFRPWNRQPSEPAMWYVRFKHYVLLGTTRTIRGAAVSAYAEYGLPNTANQEPSVGHWYDIAQSWNWKERACAYDNFQLEYDRVQLETKRRQSKLARIALLESYQDKLVTAANMMLPDMMSPRDIVTGIDTVVKQLRAEFDDEPNQRQTLSGGESPIRVQIEGELSNARQRLIDRLTRIATSESSGNDQSDSE
jgi:hypothetical protein